MPSQVQINVEQIRVALENDAEFFINFFMGDELTYPVPDFHIDIFYLMTHTDVKFFVCAIPRDHAKTTLAKLACVWYLLFSKYQFIVYLSNTADVAIPSTNDIVAFIESENFKAVFGAVEWHIKRDGEGTYKFRIVSLDKVCIIRALGAGKQVRGINVEHHRPQLAVIDDLEDTEIIATEKLYTKLKKWLYGPFMKCLDKFGHKVIQLGNIVQSPCLLDLHCKSEFWFSRRYGCILQDGKPLWPDAWPIKKLREDFRRYQEAGETDVWFAEMMNLPMAPGGGIIQADEIAYEPQKEPGDLQYGFLTVDLAISSETWAHKTVVVAHGFDEESELWQVVEYRYWTGIDPVQLFYQIVDMANKWRFFVVGIESIAFQASLQHIYRHLALMEGFDFLTFRPLGLAYRKTHRIATWASMLKRSPTKHAQYALNQGDFVATQQLLTYNPTKKDNDDDIIDACARGVEMQSMYLADIMRQVRPELTHKPKSIYQISAV